MKVIAKASSTVYICEVSHEELEKFLNQYYGTIKSLEVGQSVDLGQGYNFSLRIENACKTMAGAMKEFERAQKTMTDFAVAIAKAKGGAA